MRQRVSHLNRYRVALAALAAIVFALLGGRGAIQAQPGDTITLAPAVSPPGGSIADVEFAVTLTLNGDGKLCPAQEISTPSDILLVIDRSDSMKEAAGAGLGSKLDLLKDAAKTFVQQVDLSRDRVGTVLFDALAYTDVAPTNDAGLLQSAIDNIQVGSDTSIAAGIEQAARQFKLGADPGRRKVMVVLSDGESDLNMATTAAEAARKDGARIITIALGSSANQTLLQKVASQPSDFYPVTDPNQLRPVYETIAREIRKPVAARDLTVRHTFNASAIEVDPSSISSGGRLNGNVITWQLPEQLNNATQLSYTARPRAPGDFAIDQGTEVSYLSCEVTPSTLSRGPALNVNVQPLPSPTTTLTPRPTLTPGPTPLPTTTPTLPEQLQLGAANVICTSNWINILLWLLAIALTIWFLWRFVQEMRAADDPLPPTPGQPVRRPNPCGWLLWLFLPLSLILLVFLLPILAGPGCGARESVYFWRIGGGQSSGSIYVTDAGSSFRSQPARPLVAFSQGKCVGCHAVSSSTYNIASIVGGGAGNVEVRSLDGEPVDIPQVSGSYVAWSPDGSKMAVSTGDQQLAIVDIARRSVTPLQGANDPTLAQVMPAWSPDGQTIAFVRGPRSNEAWTIKGSSDIYTIPATGGQAAPLIGASGEGYNYYPSFSPDGRWLAFTRHLSGTTTYAAPEAEIFLVPSTGGERIRLAANDGPNGQPLVGASNSWPTWSRDGTVLAFTSKRDDPSYDVFITSIDANGISGPAQPLAGASEAGVFEHLPFWGVPPQVDPWAAILALWPCLIPFLLVFLAWLVCCSRKADPVAPMVEPRLPPKPLDAASLYPLWQVAPSLIVGVGGTGRWVLTHLKKTLRDGGGGALPPQVKFVLLDTAEREQATQFRDARGQLTRVEFAGVSLDANEVFLLDQSVRELIAEARKNSDAALADWVPESYGSLNLDVTSLATGTKGRRPLARLGLIDKLRGGAASAAPPAPGAVYSDATALWQTLLAASAAVKDGDQIRIVVVGPLAGGMSGTVFDLAYLARRAARKVLGGNKVYLEGYLTTAGAMQQPADLPRMQLNTMAALRELQRFQLFQGAPARFTYATGAGEAAEPLAGSLSWPLFDTVTLFGDKVNPERSSGNVKKSDEPWATTFAAMADTIAFGLERAVAQELEQGRAATLSAIGTRQREVDQAVVRSAGSFVYRLPLVDILEIIRARWAFQLLDMFLEGGGGSAQPGRAAEGIVERADRSAERFVLAEHEAGAAPNGMRAAGLLATGRTVQARRIVGFGTEDGRPFADYLNHALLLVLQGHNPSPEQRGPRLDEARSFVAAVIRLLTQARRATEQAAAKAPNGSSRSFWRRIIIWLGRGQAFRSEWEQAGRRIDAWIAVANQTAISLKEINTLIYGSAELEGERFIGLYRELENLQAKAVARREQMDQVAVRRYLWSVPISPDGDPADPRNQQNLVEQWFPQAQARLREYLPRFSWSMRSDGTVVFGVDRHKILVQQANHETIRALITAIDDLAIHATQDLAVVVRGSGLRETTELVYQIKDVLPSQLPSSERRPEERLIQQIWPIAQPHLDPARDNNGDVDGVVTGMAGVPDNVRDDARYQQLLKVLDDLGTPRTRVEGTADLIRTRTIVTKDRTALTLVREYARLPMLRVVELMESLRVYARNAGRQTDQLVDPASEAAVFTAEANALEYERRLEAPALINQDFRLLHPLLVTALEQPEVTQLYGLALAAGWLRADGGEVFLSLPGEAAQQLERLNVIDAHPLVQALLRLTTSAVELPLVDRLRRAIATPTADTSAAWQRFIQSFQPRRVAPVVPPAPMQTGPRHCANCGAELKPGARFCGKCKTPVPPPAPPLAPQPAPQAGPPLSGAGQDARDLAAIAALAAARAIDPAGWDNLVMVQPRKFR